MPINLTIREDFLILSNLFTSAPFSTKILATSTLPFIEAKRRKMNKRVECHLTEKKKQTVAKKYKHVIMEVYNGFKG